MDSPGQWQHPLPWLPCRPYRVQPYVQHPPAQTCSGSPLSAKSDVALVAFQVLNRLAPQSAMLARYPTFSRAAISCTFQKGPLS